MSAQGKEARPDRCYCGVHDGGASLNDIAEIIAALNHKILCLRNEVNAFKNVGANGETKRSLEETSHGHLSAPCYETEPDISRSDAQLEGPSNPEAAVAHVIPLRTRSIIDYQLREKVDDEALAGILKNGVNRYSNLVRKELPRDRGKKVSRGVQCDPTRHKGIRYFLNWFRTELLFAKDTFFKRNKDAGSCPEENERTSFDFAIEPGDRAGNKEDTFASVYPENSGVDEDLREDFEEDAFNGKIDWTLEAAKIEQNGDSGDRLDRAEENKIFKIGRDKGSLQKDEEHGRLGPECSIIQCNHPISNFNAKMRNDCLHESVKFDVTNVKGRLDACIAELNEMIEDVTLIFPNLNPSDGPKY